MESIPNYIDRFGQDWYSSLYAEMYELLYYYSYKITHHKEEAEDIVAHCFAKLGQLIANDPQKFTDRYHVKSYLYKMVANASISYCRARQKSNAINMDVERLESLDVEALTSELEEHEMYEKLLSCVDKLSPKSKEIIWLFFYEGMTAPEIAEKLQQPVTSIYTAKKRALKQLANMLKNKKQPVTSNSLVLLFWLYLTTP